jgi:hypothetical protein
MANIRLKPDIGSIIIYQAPQDTILESSAREGEWYLIKIKTEEGQTVSGYVHESVVMVLEGPAQKKETIEIKKVPEKEVKKEPEKKRAEKKPPAKPATAQPASQPYKFHIDFSLSGGASYVSAKDLNDGAKGAVDLQNAKLAKEQSGTASPAHLSYIIGGEIAFSLSSLLCLGLGADYFQGENESEVKFFESGKTIATLTVRPKFQALPLRLFLVYQPLPLFYLKGGIEYYFAKCSYLYDFQGAPALKQEGEAKAQRLGLMGAIVMERKLFSIFNYFLEITGRYAKIRGFKGTHTETNQTAPTEGKLYYFLKRASLGGDLYPQLFIRKDSTTQPLEENFREAVIDFSGLSLKAGFKIKF